MASEKSVIPVERIEQLILSIRGQKVILAADLAALYGVATKQLNQQVKRNRKRFPEDFMFQLNAGEKAEVVTNCNHLAKLKFSPTLPYAFTEHGAIMAASVLNTEQAVKVSVFVVRAFLKLRDMLASHKELSSKLAELESRLEERLGEHDEKIYVLAEAIRQLMRKPRTERRKIGFPTGKGPET